MACRCTALAGVLLESAELDNYTHPGNGQAPICDETMRLACWEWVRMNIVWHTTAPYSALALGDGRFTEGLCKNEPKWPIELPGWGQRIVMAVRQLVHDEPDLDETEDADAARQWEASPERRARLEILKLMAWRSEPKASPDFLQKAFARIDLPITLPMARYAWRTWVLSQRRVLVTSLIITPSPTQPQVSPGCANLGLAPLPEVYTQISGKSSWGSGEGWARAAERAQKHVEWWKMNWFPIPVTGGGPDGGTPELQTAMGRLPNASLRKLNRRKSEPDELDRDLVLLDNGVIDIDQVVERQIRRDAAGSEAELKKLCCTPCSPLHKEKVRKRIRTRQARQKNPTQ